MVLYHALNDLGSVEGLVEKEFLSAFTASEKKNLRNSKKKGPTMCKVWKISLTDP